MTDVSIFDLDPTDLDAALRVRSLSFGHTAAANVEPWHRMQRAAIEERRLLGAYVGGQVAGVARINDFRQWWHGRDLRMAGVAGVVVGPEYRGRGVGKTLMAAVVVRARELGYPISALYPATIPVYRSLGWELAGRQYRVSVPTRALRTLARGLDIGTAVRRLEPGQGQAIFDMINDLHRAHRDAGPLSYTVEQWDEWLTDEPQAVGYLADDGIALYDWSGDGSLHVEYLGAASEQTARTLWSLVGSGSSVAKTVTAYLAPDDPLPWLLPDLGLTPDRENWWMLRLLDPTTAFTVRGYPDGTACDVTVSLTDPQLPDLDGSWQLTVRDGAGSFVRTAALAGAPAADQSTGGAASAPYGVGPRGLAGLYAGTRLSVLRRAGLVTGGSADDDRCVDAVFAATPFLIDYF